jgi:hypothetical protein
MEEIQDERERNEGDSKGGITVRRKRGRREKKTGEK